LPTGCLPKGGVRRLGLRGIRSGNETVSQARALEAALALPGWLFTLRGRSRS
jgi:hypothetical protein